MKKYLLAVMICLGVFLSSAVTASACSCLVPGPNISLKSQVRSAKLPATTIFVGKVISIRYSDEKMNGQPVKLYAQFAVERSWKGSQDAIIEVETANICCICGYTFEEGKSYIVYSNSASTITPGVTSCSRTSPIVGKSPDEKYLGKPRTIIKP